LPSKAAFGRAGAVVWISTNTAGEAPEGYDITLVLPAGKCRVEEL